MKPELREQILAYNKASKVRKEKSSDLDIIVSAMLKLPPGQLKKMLTDDVIAILDKYSGLVEEKGCDTDGPDW